MATAKAKRSASKILIRKSAIEPAAIYSTADAAIVTDLSKVTLWRATKSGHLRCLKVGRRTLYRGEALLAYVTAGQQPGRKLSEKEIEQIESRKGVA